MSVPEGRGGAEPAGLVSRGIAALLDILVLALTGVSVQLGAGCARLLVAGPPFRMPALDGRIAGVIGWTFAVCYFGGAWAMTGQSVGGRLMGIRVGDRAGHRLGLPRALLRAALSVTFPLGLLWIPFSRRRAAVPDLVVAAAVRYDGP
ncbi:RDD family protein [Streptomyces sp. SID8379]|uniref:RDD family protein n=1 Tax=unclassified Streptomyces TaxID=2593676 RepID=UPI0003637743|nr:MULTISPECIES: RDD family protein [unclassified Streptomyces]MYW63355.1 RDD family protein [Streptomyces sp. SID8379]